MKQVVRSPIDSVLNVWNLDFMRGVGYPKKMNKVELAFVPGYLNELGSSLLLEPLRTNT